MLIVMHNDGVGNNTGDFRGTFQGNFLVVNPLEAYNVFFGQRVKFMFYNILYLAMS